MSELDDDSEIPEYGVVFTYGKSKFNNNKPGKFWLKDDGVVFVSCGDEHTAIISESGILYAFGDNSWGQLGLGHTKSYNRPVKVKRIKEQVKQVSCGKSHTIVLTEKGIVYGFGCNSENQLGIESENERVLHPALILFNDDEKIIMIAAGADHSLFLSDKGKLFICGSNSEQQLGLEHSDCVKIPAILPFKENIKYISCGYYHSAIVTESGSLHVMGNESEDEEENADIKRIKKSAIRKVKFDGQIEKVECGHYHTAFTTSSGDVFTFGGGSNGQLALGNLCLFSEKPSKVITWPRKISKIVDVACGEAHTAFISANGSLFMSGDGRHGKLALGNEGSLNCFRPHLVSRFRKFKVLQTSCGGCHTVIIARRRHKGEHESSDDEVVSPINNGQQVDNVDVAHAEHVNNMSPMRRTDMGMSFDLLGGSIARSRRREKLPDLYQSLPRQLPALHNEKNLNENSEISKPLNEIGQEEKDAIYSIPMKKKLVEPDPRTNKSIDVHQFNSIQKNDKLYIEKDDSVNIIKDKNVKRKPNNKTQEKSANKTSGSFNDLSSDDELKDKHNDSIYDTIKHSDDEEIPREKHITDAQNSENEVHHHHKLKNGSPQNTNKHYEDRDTKNIVIAKEVSNPWINKDESHESIESEDESITSSNEDNKIEHKDEIKDDKNADIKIDKKEKKVSFFQRIKSKRTKKISEKQSDENISSPDPSIPNKNSHNLDDKKNKDKTKIEKESKDEEMRKGLDPNHEIEKKTKKKKDDKNKDKSESDNISLTNSEINSEKLNNKNKDNLDKGNKKSKEDIKNKDDNKTKDGKNKDSKNANNEKKSTFFRRFKNSSKVDLDKESLDSDTPTSDEDDDVDVNKSKTKNNTSSPDQGEKSKKTENKNSSEKDKNKETKKDEKLSKPTNTGSANSSENKPELSASAGDQKKSKACIII